MSKHSKPTIAFLLRDIVGTVGPKLWDGVRALSEKLDFNIITLAGETLGQSASNSVYELAKSSLVDGIITWASSDVDDVAQRFYARLHGKVIVTLTLPIPGLPLVSIDSYPGMKEAVKHLVSVHGRKKVAFIRGPEAHISANERYMAYLDALKEEGIPVNEKLVTPPLRFFRGSAAEACRIFFKDRGLSVPKDIDAVACVNDDIAVALLGELKARGLRVPEDVALVGYNNSESALCTSPPLNTVEAPFDEQAEIAAKLCLEQIRTGSPAQSVKLRSRAIFNQSCGCDYSDIVLVRDLAARQIQNAAHPDKTRKRKREQQTGLGSSLDSANLTQTVLEELLTAIPENFRNEGDLPKQAAALVDAFAQSLRQKDAKIFVKRFSDLGAWFLENKLNPDNLNSVLSRLSYSEDLALSDEEEQKIAGAARDESRLILSRLMKQGYRGKDLLVQDRLSALRLLSSDLTSIKDIPSLCLALERQIPKFGIEAFYLCLYDDKTLYRFMENSPEKASLVFAFSGGKVLEIRADSAGFRSVDILPSGILQEIKRMDFVVLPLVFETKQLGYVVIENGPRDNNIYPLIKETISSGVNNIFLIKELQAAQASLAGSLNALKEKADLIFYNSRAVSEKVGDAAQEMEKADRNIKSISMSIGTVMESVNKSSELGKNVSEILRGLLDHSQQIGEVTGFISNIAEQSNVLAINAAIEAARAGTAGKGFSVVAQEVKGLSQKTVQSTQRIEEIISLIQASTGSTVKNIEKLIGLISSIEGLSSNITGSIREQSSATSAISELLDNAARSTKEITAAIAEVADKRL